VNGEVSTTAVHMRSGFANHMREEKDMWRPLFLTSSMQEVQEVAVGFGSTKCDKIWYQEDESCEAGLLAQGGAHDEAASGQHGQGWQHMPQQS